MNSLQGYSYDPASKRIYSDANVRHRRWSQLNRNRTPEWNNTQRTYRAKLKEDGTIAEVKNLRARQMLSRAKSRAKKKGLKFNLHIEDIRIPDVCPITLRPFYFRACKAHPDSPSLDRINPKRGYVRGNVQVISWRANMLKSNSDLAISLRLALNIAQSTARDHYVAALRQGRN